MKILFNGYIGLMQKKQFAGGPRGFTKLMVDDFLSKKLELVSITLLSTKDKGLPPEIKKTSRKGLTDYYIRTPLYMKKILAARKAVMPNERERALSILRDVITKEKPDVLFMNGFSIANWYILRAASDLKIPSIVVHHGLWYKDLQYAHEVKSKAGEALTKNMEADIARLASKQIFLNEFSAGLFSKDILKVSPQKKVIVPLPFNTVFEGGAGKKAGQTVKPKIGMVGRWDGIKNAEGYLALAKQSAKEKRNLEFSAILRIKPDYKPLKKFEKDFPKYVSVIDKLSPKQLSKWYRTLSVLVVPSHFDVSPTVVMEALLSGVPVAISPNVGWTSFYKANGLRSWIIDFEKPNALERLERMATETPNSKALTKLRTLHNPKNIFATYRSIIYSFKAYENRTARK